MRYAVALALIAVSAPLAARDPIRAELPAYIQCAPYARQVSGIQLFGEARDWWTQAQTRYATGRAPRVGAVMAFRATAAMRSGHVATVTAIVDSRTVLLDHANWSPIDGRRGQIERGVHARDVSPSNDWSQVTVWYAPVQALGTTVWPIDGFIYPDRTRTAAPVIAAATARPVLPAQPSKAFAKAFADFAPARP